VILHVDVPLQPGSLAAFEKFAIRRGDFAEASVAVRLSWDGLRIADARISLGAVSPFPVRPRAAERALIGERPGDKLIRSAAASTIHGSLPLSKNRYKTHLLVSLAERAIRRAMP